MKLLFWVSVVGIFYTYFGYPIILWLIAKIKPNPLNKSNITPDISIIIAAYNEEDVIGERIENILTSDYPNNKREIIVSSDGSTDATNEIVKKLSSIHSNVRLVVSEKRRGKAYALNMAIPQAKGEILVFTDANTNFERSTLRKLVRALADIRVGCVAGRKVIYGKGKNREAEGFYWKYENFLKTLETLVHSCMGADGAIYAIRKRLYCFPDPNRGYSDDGMISMYVICQGYRLVYEPDAKAYETTSSSPWKEYKRKIRTLSGGLEWMASLWRLLVPFRSPVWWQLFSHRLLRFMLPFFITGLMVSSAYLGMFCSHGLSIYSLAFMVLLTIYGFGLSSILGCSNKICRVCFYFGYMNFSFLSALIRFLTRNSEKTWDKLGR